ncbi:MAG: stage II sporulation protein P [Clostridia bacterium]|nr:stage II sporulation protein P [Clostridia bacterium]
MHFKIYNFRRSKLFKRVFITLFLGCFLMGAFFFWNSSNNQEYIAVSTGEFVREPGLLVTEFAKILELLGINSDMRLQQIISEGYPLVQYSDNQGYTKGNNLRTLVKNGLNFITDLDSNDPTSFLKFQLAVLASIDFQTPVIAASYDREEEEDFYLNTPPELEEWHFEVEQNVPIELGDEPLVLIYNTHNAETYKPTFGTSKEEGKNSGIVTVAQVMEETLEKKYGIKTIRSQTIHDYPDFTRSYINSMHTVQEILKANKKIQAVFDVHRDAGIPSKSTTTVKINGKSSASIIIVIGTEHKGWKENLVFAEELEKKANELYPGLLRDIRMAKNRRYNQNLHPNSLILEIGSDLNTLEEAKYSMELFSQVVAEVLKERQ